MVQLQHILKIISRAHGSYGQQMLLTTTSSARNSYRRFHRERDIRAHVRNIRAVALILGQFEPFQ